MSCLHVLPVTDFKGLEALFATRVHFELTTADGSLALKDAYTL